MMVYIRSISFLISAVDNGTMQWSPIFFGILLTLLVLISYCMVRVLWKRSQQQKNDDVIDGSKQSSSLLCTGVGGNGNGNANNANHMDTIAKVCASLSMHCFLPYSIPLGNRYTFFRNFLSFSAVGFVILYDFAWHSVHSCMCLTMHQCNGKCLFYITIYCRNMAIMDYRL